MKSKSLALYSLGIGYIMWIISLFIKFKVYDLHFSAIVTLGIAPISGIVSGVVAIKEKNVLMFVMSLILFFAFPISWGLASI